MPYLEIDGEQIPKGNFSFLYDVTNNENIFNKFYDAERNLKVDYMDFAHKIRMAFESFAVEEEARRRKHSGKYKDKTLSAIKEEIINKIKTPASIINYKTIIIDFCKGKELEFAPMLEKYSFVRCNAHDDEICRKFKAFVRYLYAFGSESSHENVVSSSKYAPNKENCIKVAKSFHDFLCIYYGISKKFESTLVPIRGYYAVPHYVVEKMGLTLELGKSLFVKEKQGKISYYIFSSNTEGINKGQRRDIDVINKLWEDNFNDPLNIIRQTESISGSNRDYSFQVYALPGKPLKLTEEFLSKLSFNDKLDIILGLIRGVESIHHYETPLYHRNISPEAFYIFEIKGKYKPLLAKFDCTKDSSEVFTVYQNVENKAKDDKENQYFAPEVINSTLGQGVDWEKADIYSLAKTIIFILVGRNSSVSKIFEALDKVEVDDMVKITLATMLDDNPLKRPDLSELTDSLKRLVVK